MMTSIVSFAILFLFTLTHITSAIENDYSGVLADHFQSLSPRAGSRFLKDSAAGPRKGEKCEVGEGSVCPGPPGVPAKKGTQLLNCCKGHCRNMLTDRNHCGGCGNRCGFGQLCCNSVCTVVAYDAGNCGKCGNKCKPGIRCEYGNCGYAG